MQFPGLSRYGLTVILLLISGAMIQGQVLISGTVYDRSRFHTMQGVSVLGSSGIGTVTDSLGKYHIRLPLEDSIRFSYLGKSTVSYPVRDFAGNPELDMSIDVNVDSLPSVYVRPRNYYLDSLANRQEYQRVFDYEGAGGLDNMKAGRGRGMGVGLDFDMFFSAKKNRQMLAFQKRLIEEEQDKYIDHRFSLWVVKRVTGLQSPALDTFMRRYRPSYEFTKSLASDWEFYEYILSSGRFFAEVWKEEHPDIPPFAPKPVFPDPPVVSTGKEKDSVRHTVPGQGAE